MSRGRSPNTLISFTSGSYPFDREAANTVAGAMRHDDDESIQSRSRNIELNPKRTTAQTLSSVKRSASDVAVIPFYHPKTGYAVEALWELAAAFDLVATQLVPYRPEYDLVMLADAPNAGDFSDARPDIITTEASRAACDRFSSRASAAGASFALAYSDELALQQLRRESSRMFSHSADTGKTLVAMIAPATITRGNQALTIIQRNIGDVTGSGAYFLGVQRATDETALFDKYKTTDARTRYFHRRMRRVLSDHQTIHSDGMTKDVVGLNVLLQFSRTDGAAGIGDIEARLRTYGVRYGIIEHPQREAAGGSQIVVLDIEFQAEDFRYLPHRRLSGAVANGVLKRAFMKWKNRNALVLGAMPIAEFRLAKTERRRWWAEGADNAVQSFQQTMFIRFSRILFYALIMLLGVWIIARFIFT